MAAKDHGKKSRWIIRAGIMAVAVFLLIQLIPVNRQNPPVEAEVPAPPRVRAILQNACYDCHSNETKWPWYSRVAPVSWLVAHDIDEGREYLNYSTWNRYSDKQKTELMAESIEEIDEGEMPPWFYRAMHSEAVLSDEDKALFRKWARLQAPGPLPPTP